MDEKTLKYMKWASSILALLGIVGGILAAAEKLPLAIRDWAALIVAILMGVRGWVERQLPPKQRTPANPAKVGALLVGLLFLGGAAGCVSAGVKLAHGGMVATNTTAQALADAHRVYGDKVCPHIKRFRSDKGARQFMRLGVAGAVAAVKAKGDGLSALMPGLCELHRLFQAAKGDLGKFGQSVADGLKPFGALVCPKASVAGALAVILPVAAAVIKWLMDLVGKPDKDRLAEVAAWLKAPPSDATDSLCKD